MKYYWAFFFNLKAIPGVFSYEGHTPSKYYPRKSADGGLEEFQEFRRRRMLAAIAEESTDPEVIEANPEETIATPIVVTTEEVKECEKPQLKRSTGDEGVDVVDRLMLDFWVTGKLDRSELEEFMGMVESSQLADIYRVLPEACLDCIASLLRNP